MHRYAIFIDAGYLAAQALAILAGKPTNVPKPVRRDLRIPDAGALIKEIRHQAESSLGNTNCLRAYWYDGVGQSLTPEQAVIAALHDVQFRAGTIHNTKQKGVDSRIVHDLFELASNRAISDAMVVTGDGDIAVGIEFAQRRGVRVSLLSIEDASTNVQPNRHPELMYLADRQVSLGREEIERYFRYEKSTPEPPPKKAKEPIKSVVAEKAAATKQDISPADRAIADVLDGLEGSTLASVLNENGGIKPLLDKLLLSKAREYFGRMLETQERNDMRKSFIAAVRSKAQS